MAISMFFIPIISIEIYFEEWAPAVKEWDSTSIGQQDKYSLYSRDSYSKFLTSLEINICLRFIDLMTYYIFQI